MATNTLDPQDDVASYFGQYFHTTWKYEKRIEPGQIVVCASLEHERKHWIADVTRADGRSHTEATFDVRKQKPEDFRGKGERLPIAALKLGNAHEIVLARAKMRRCVVLGCVEELCARTLPEGVERNKALNAFAGRYVLAPIYSVSRPGEPRTFGPTIVARVRGLMYPNLFYVGASGSILKWPGVARLDHLFTSELACDCELTHLRLADSALGILMEHVHVMFGSTPSPEYAELRELLMSCIPGEHRTPQI